MRKKILNIILLFFIGFIFLFANFISALSATGYYYPGTDSGDKAGSSDDYIYFLLIAVFLSINWVISKISDEVKEKIIRLMFISSPICLIILLGGIFFIPSGNSNLIFDVLFGAALLVLVCLYFLLANWPASSAYFLMHELADFFSTPEISLDNFWPLLDKIKKRRMFVFFGLLALLGAVALVDIYLFLGIGNHRGGINPGLGYLLLATGFALIVIYLFQEYVRYGKVGIPESGHKRTEELAKAIANMAIVAGISAPKFKILAHDNPNAFSLCSNHGLPTIYVTTALLNLADKNELEAVIAHETAFVSSGRIFDYKMIHNLLSALRMFSFLLLLLFLLALDPWILAFWLFAVIYASSGYLKTSEWNTDSRSFFITLVALANPPFLLANFLSYLIYYRFSYDEDFYADLQTIQFIRYTRGLYSILEKLNDYVGPSDKLPEEFYYLYFAGERAVSGKIPMPQPTLEERMVVLEKIDNTLRISETVSRAVESSCPFCGQKMEEIICRGHYGENLKIDFCPGCRSGWFDNWKLWYLAEIPSAGSVARPQAAKSADADLLCPHCGIKLFSMSDPSIPSEVAIWTCSGCGGNLLDAKSLSCYLDYKRRRTEPAG